MQLTNSNIQNSFICPVLATPLTLVKEGFRNQNNIIYKKVVEQPIVIDFVEPHLMTSQDQFNLSFYSNPASLDIYRNFLDWLFLTFDTDESSFRKDVLNRLNIKPKQRILIVGCGLGEDITAIKSIVGDDCEIHAQDISKSMVLNAASNPKLNDVTFTISNGLNLPYQSGYFDIVYHFGGINLFGDMKKAIAELARVCKIGGQVLFGDEGISPHLRDSEYAKIAINNNHLWSNEAPLKYLPISAQKLELTYVLGNCFYLIHFEVGDGYPKMNIDIPHKGRRGGTARTRYFGQVEGVDPKLKDSLNQRATELNCSAHDYLNSILSAALEDKNK
ncbi:MAG: methyltransferase domain-containing protein [Candidatus Pacebacteria bacterium]|nr:methyltransferase domain-containing protein [Candidatus Paceibacterota bacterium]